MAYMSQERKKELTPAIQAVLKKYNIKGSISVRNHSTLVVKLLSGDLDFGKDYGSVNIYHIETNYPENQRAISFLKELKNAMDIGNYDRSDIQSDYFDVGWYKDIIIGSYDKRYVFTGVHTLKPDPEITPETTPEITHTHYQVESDIYNNTFGTDEEPSSEYEVYKIIKDSDYKTISMQLIATFLHEVDANSFVQYKKQQRDL